MLSAETTDSGEVFSIQEVTLMSKLAKDGWAAYSIRGMWICHGCGGDAWPCRNSKSGEGMHFKAHHTRPDCPMIGRNVGNAPGHINEDRPAINNMGEVVELVLARPRGKAAETRADGTEPDGSGRPGRGRTTDFGVIGARQQTASLRPTLDTLRKGGLRAVGQRIKIPERGEVLREDLFWRLEDLDPAEQTKMGRLVIVWGRIATVNAGLAGVFLNQGPHGANAGAIVIADDVAEDLVSRWGNSALGSIGGLAGWDVIALGRPRPMAGGAMVRIDVEDPTRIAVLTP